MSVLTSSAKNDQDEKLENRASLQSHQDFTVLKETKEDHGRYSTDVAPNAEIQPASNKINGSTTATSNNSQQKLSCPASGAIAKRAGSRRKRRNRRRASDTDKQQALEKDEEKSQEAVQCQAYPSESCAEQKRGDYKAALFEPTSTLANQSSHDAVTSGGTANSQILPPKISGKSKKKGSKKKHKSQQISASQADAEAAERRWKAITSVTDLLDSHGSQYREKLFKLGRKMPELFSCKVEVMCQGFYLLDSMLENLDKGHRLLYPDTDEIERNSLKEIMLNGKTMMACEMGSVSVIDSAEVLKSLKPDMILWFDKKTLGLFVMPLCDTKMSLYSEFEDHSKPCSIPSGKEFPVFSAKSFLDWYKNSPASQDNLAVAEGIKLYVGDWKCDCLEIVLIPKLTDYLLGKK